MLSRRRFLAALAASAAARRTSAVSGLNQLFAPPATAYWHAGQAYSLAVHTNAVPEQFDPPRFSPRRNPDAPFDWKAAGRDLQRRFADLPRHFVFEYYPWYGTSPWRHWNQWDRQPPADIAATSIPQLGPYDSLDPRVIEQHAQWIAESGAGAINISWWGPGSYEDRAVPLVMDVMRDHGLKVTFHLEPYRHDRAQAYASDVLYLLREYGEKRRWDALLLLRDEKGDEAPVFKSFATVLPPESTDCKGRTSPVALFAPDEVWREQTDTIRETLRHDFAQVRLFADSGALDRVRAGGFDGIAMYDNYLRPSIWPGLARACRDFNLLFSFNINAGFDGIAPRAVDPEGCGSTAPPAFEPPDTVDWTSLRGRDRARQAAQRRINESARTTVGLQTDTTLSDFRGGFFLVYINSFNEWHEGTAFEPAKPVSALTPAERQSYHNPIDGDYRLQTIGALLDDLL